MSLSMYQASMPAMLQMLSNLRKLLERGEAHAQARKFDSAVLAGSRLAPDMYPLTRQVMIATDAAKGCGARLSGSENPKFEDTEQTLAELIARVDKTIAYLKSLKPEQFDGSETRAIVIKTPFAELNFTGEQYLMHFALPNFYFHVTTAYNILRHNGVEIGKRDFLGGAR